MAPRACILALSAAALASVGSAHAHGAGTGTDVSDMDMGHESCKCKSKYETLPRLEDRLRNCTATHGWFVDYAAAGSQCLPVNISGRIYDYEASYGDYCAQHQEPGQEDCWDMATGMPKRDQETQVGQAHGLDPAKEDWCHTRWCYVDPCDCTLAGTMASGYFPHLWYSNYTCHWSQHDDNPRPQSASTLPRIGLPAWCNNTHIEHPLCDVGMRETLDRDPAEIFQYRCHGLPNGTGGYHEFSSYPGECLELGGHVEPVSCAQYQREFDGWFTHQGHTADMRMMEQYVKFFFRPKCCHGHAFPTYNLLDGTNGICPPGVPMLNNVVSRECKNARGEEIRGFNPVFMTARDCNEMGGIADTPVTCRMMEWMASREFPFPREEPFTAEMVREHKRKLAPMCCMWDNEMGDFDGTWIIPARGPPVEPREPVKCDGRNICSGSREIKDDRRIGSACFRPEMDANGWHEFDSYGVVYDNEHPFGCANRSRGVFRKHFTCGDVRKQMERSEQPGDCNYRMALLNKLCCEDEQELGGGIVKGIEAHGFNCRMDPEEDGPDGPTYGAANGKFVFQGTMEDGRSYYRHARILNLWLGFDGPDGIWVMKTHKDWHAPTLGVSKNHSIHPTDMIWNQVMCAGSDTEHRFHVRFTPWMMERACTNAPPDMAMRHRATRCDGQDYPEEQDMHGHHPPRTSASSQPASASARRMSASAPKMPKMPDMHLKWPKVMMPQVPVAKRQW